MSSNYNDIKPVDQLKNILLQLGLLLDEFEKQQPQKVQVNCPFCNSNKSTTAFAYKSYIYRTCGQCQSLYLSPRITRQWLGKYYSFMHERICFEIPQSHRQARIDNIMRPRWDLLTKKLTPYIKHFPVKRYMEVGPGVGYFTEVAQQNNYAEQYILVEPDKHCHKYLRELKGATVLFDGLLEDCNIDDHGKIDIIFINSVIEHPYSLNVFFDKLRSLLNHHGTIVLIDMYSQGFDIEILREKTPNVNPYSILQVGSIEGIKTLCLNNGLLMKDVFSIGKMDIDILFEYSKQLPHDHPLKGFENILANREVRSDLQDVLAKHLLTGYNGYIIQKREK